MESVFFNADNWYWKTLEDFIAYQDMHDFVSNKIAMDAYNSSMRFSSIGQEAHDSNTSKKIINSIEGSLKGSLDHFAGLTIVAMCTTFEVAAKDFFRNLFIINPKYMYEYIGSENKKGLISLHEIINSGDFEKLICNLSEKASSAVSKGKYGEIISRAFKLCGIEKDDTLEKNINLVQAGRNKIVHEKEVVSREVKDVSDAQGIIAEALEALVKCAQHKKIPGRYTCVTPEKVLFANSITVVDTD